MSMPSSRALVLTTASSSPEAMRASMLRRSSGRKPARYAEMRSLYGPDWLPAQRLTSSVIRRERQ